MEHCTTKHWNSTGPQQKSPSCSSTVLAWRRNLQHVAPCRTLAQPQLHDARVVPVVLQHELLPGQREEVAEGVHEVALPGEVREGRAVQDVVAEVEVLDG
eukprot:11082923-Lingulodinium_polyedra.AAC.1